MATCLVTGGAGFLGSHLCDELLRRGHRVICVDNLPPPPPPIDFLRLPLHTLKVGSHGTHHTLGLAKKHRARFLLASTSVVYGDPREHPQRETYWGHVNPIGPRACYDESKRFGEALTTVYLREYGVDARIIRIFN